MQLNTATVIDLSLFKKQKALLDRVSQPTPTYLGVPATVEHLIKSIASLKVQLPPNYRRKLTSLEIVLEEILSNIKDD
jgi:hypothetical protein|tara:strand:- start:339 stop:572 length:234 start_codon:yes stop_codon:yes gene_type:complete